MVTETAAAFAAHIHLLNLEQIATFRDFCIAITRHRAKIIRPHIRKALKTCAPPDYFDPRNN